MHLRLSLSRIAGMISFLTIFCLIAAPNDTSAQTDEDSQTRYWKLSSVSSSSGTDTAYREASGSESFQFGFSPDEALCRKAYGKEWYDMCSRRTFMEGRGAPDASLSPPLRGEWRWAGDMELNFTPDTAWPAGTSFRLVLAETGLPPDTKLVRPVRFMSQDIQVSLRGDFKFDPYDLNKMAVSGSFHFNYPMDRESVLSRIRIRVPEARPSAGLLLGDPAFTWQDNRDGKGYRTLLFSVPVLSLPENSPGTVEIVLEDGAMAISGGKPSRGVSYHLSTRSRSDLFQVESNDSIMVVTPELEGRQVQTLTFSLPVKAADIQKDVDMLLLPRQRNEEEEKIASSPYSWWTTAEITPEVLQRSRPVKFLTRESGDAPSLTASFELLEEVEQGRSLLLTLRSGLTGTDGLTLRSEKQYLAQIPSLSGDLKIMQNGAILSLRGDKKLALYSRGLDSINYTVSRIRPEFLSLFAGHNYGTFEDPEVYSWSLDYVSENMSGTLPVPLRDAASAQFSALDLAPFLKDNGRGLFQVSLEGRGRDSRYFSDNRFVLVTDLGLIHKVMVDGTSMVFAASLHEGKPARNTEIQVLGSNGLPVFEGKTDKDGRVTITDLSSLSREKTPKAIVARQGSDLAFLPWNDSGRLANYSRFDIGGDSSIDGMYAYMFSQRDMYRPGESVHFGYMVKPQVWGDGSLEELPLKAVVYDSRQSKFSEQMFSLPDSGMGELNYTLPENTPTGTYRLDLLTGDGYMVLASRSFQVEEFQPDTLRLSLAVSPIGAAGWLRPEDIAAGAGGGLEARANLMNLFGAPAADHRMRASLEVGPALFRFRKYPEWYFHDAALLPQGRTEILPDRQTDDQGDTVWTLPVSSWEGASARLNLLAEGFDANGGRSVKASAQVQVSPLDRLVGWRTGSNLNYLRKDAKAEVEVLAVGPDLEPVAAKDLRLELVAVSYVKSLVRDENGQYRYESLRQEKLVNETPFDLPTAGKTITLNVSEPGEWLLLFKDGEDRIVNRIPYTVAGNTLNAFGEDREPRLTAKLDKEDYNPGDEVEILLSTPYSGAGLITVERDSVLAQTWFRAQAGDQVQRIRLPKDLDGQAYIIVTYFRALDDPDIFTVPTASAVVPFTVNMEGRDLGLGLRYLPAKPERSGLFGRLKAPETPQGMPVVRPGGSFQVEVTSARPGKAVVFAVDEGILQMTSYKTPDPLTALLGNRALEVLTYQYLDLLMPEYGLVRSALSAFGGGEGIDFAGQGQNPFRRPGEKSAVFWSGIVDVDGKGRVIDIPVPGHFNGQLRIMAVGCSPQAVSAARTDVKVQAEVVIQPTLPLFVTPGDVFEASVTLTDMSGLIPAGEAGRIVRLEADGGTALQLQGEQPGNIELQAARGQTMRLRFRVLDELGGSTLTFRVSPAPGQPGETVTRAVGMSVRPGLPLYSDLALGRLSDKDAEGLFTQDIPFTREMYPYYAEGTASASPLPLPLYQSLMTYLARYPYGCTEQLVSGAFPNLVLIRFPALAPPSVSADELRLRITGTLDQLGRRQNSEGGFAFWPNGYGGDLFLDAYVTDFLLTAKEMGVFVPAGLLNRAVDNLRRTASPPPQSMSDARAKAYAGWVLTRNGEITSNIMATLNAWLNSRQQNWQDDITAVFMAGSWKLMMEDNEAERLLAAYEAVPDRERAGFDYNFSPLAVRSFYLSVLAAQFPDRLGSDQAQVTMETIFRLTNGGHYVTISAAQAARALMLYSSNMTPEALNMGITAVTQDGRTFPLPVTASQDGLTVVADLSGGELDGHLLSNLKSLKITGSAPVYWQVGTTGFDKVLPLQPVREGMEIRRDFRRPDGTPADVIRLGDEIVVALTARTYGKSIRSIAIADLLPGGFEMILAEGGQAVEAGTTQGRLDDDRGMWVQYVERREDRLLLFPDLTTSDTVFRYRIKATSRGTFTLPPVSAEAMYDPTVRAMSAAGVVVVE